MLIIRPSADVLYRNELFQIKSDWIETIPGGSAEEAKERSKAAKNVVLALGEYGLMNSLEEQREADIYVTFDGGKEASGLIVCSYGEPDADQLRQITGVGFDQQLAWPVYSRLYAYFVELDRKENTGELLVGGYKRRVNKACFDLHSILYMFENANEN
ncbi:MAG: hypothetical protein WBO35_04045 [Candidatus Saccharimonadales bacterium]